MVFALLVVQHPPQSQPWAYARLGRVNNTRYGFAVAFGKKTGSAANFTNAAAAVIPP